MTPDRQTELQAGLHTADTPIRDGRTTPSPRSRRRSPAPRPPELDDQAWLERQLVTNGYAAIAKKLGVSETAVRNACRKHGIPPRPRGRRRGVSPQRPAPLFGADQVIARRYRQELDAGTSPGIKEIAKRFLALGEASKTSKTSNIVELRAAVVSLGAGCMLLLNDLQAFERMEPAA